MTRIIAFAVFFLAFSLAPTSRGQVILPPVSGGVGGVYIDADATLHQRQTDTASDLASQRLRAKALNQPPKAQDMTYVSLPRLFAEVRSAVLGMTYLVAYFGFVLVVPIFLIAATLVAARNFLTARSGPRSAGF